MNWDGAPHNNNTNNANTNRRREVSRSAYQLRTRMRYGPEVVRGLNANGELVTNAVANAVQLPPISHLPITNQSARPTLLGSQSGIFRATTGQSAATLPLAIPPVPRYNPPAYEPHNPRHEELFLPSASDRARRTARLVNDIRVRLANTTARPTTIEQTFQQPGQPAASGIEGMSLPTHGTPTRPMAESDLGYVENGETANASTRNAPSADERSSKRQRCSAEDTPRYSSHTEHTEHRLHMKIMSTNCKGVNKKAPHGWLKHPVENVLTHDQSVFVSEKPTVNLMLRHEGNTPFSVSRIVIEAPQNGFNNQLQDGLVFIGDDPEQILTDSAGYGIWYDDSELTCFEGQQRSNIHLVNMGTNVLRLQSKSRGNRDRNERHKPISHWHRYPITFVLDLGKLNWDDDTDAVKAFPLWIQAGTPGRHKWINSVKKPIELGMLNLIKFVETDEPLEASPTDQEQVTDDAAAADRLRRIEWGQGNDLSDSEYDDEEMAEIRDNRAHRFPVVWFESNVTKTLLESSGQSENMKKIIAIPQAQFRLDRKKFCSNLEFKTPITGKYILIKMFAPWNSLSLEVQTIRVYGVSGMRSVNATECV